MVNDPAEYSWSSYRSNALGVASQLCQPHSEYLALGNTKEKRLQVYRALFDAYVDGELAEVITQAVDKGLALGGDRFADQVEALYGRRVTAARIGRPKKSKSRI